MKLKGAIYKCAFSQTGVEAATWGAPEKKLFLKISQYL